MEVLYELKNSVYWGCANCVFCTLSPGLRSDYDKGGELARLQGRQT